MLLGLDEGDAKGQWGSIRRFERTDKSFKSTVIVFSSHFARPSISIYAKKDIFPLLPLYLHIRLPWHRTSVKICSKTDKIAAPKMTWLVQQQGRCWAIHLFALFQDRVTGVTVSDARWVEQES
jgi:hypothetical protein